MLFVPALLYLVALLVWSPATNLRYLAPALPPLTLLAVYFLVMTFSPGRSDEPAGPGWVALSALLLVPTLTISLGWSAARRTPARLIGLAAESEYLARVAYGNMLEVVHSLVPESDSKVLLFFEGRVFHYNRPVLADVLYRNWSMLGPIVEETDCLAATEITHVLVVKGHLAYRRMRHEVAGARPLRLSGFDRFIGECLEPIHEEPAFALYALRRD